MSSPLAYLRTEKLSVGTAGAANSTIVAPRPITLAVSSDVAFHAVIGLSDDNPTADNADPYFPPGDIYVFKLPAHSEISIRGVASGSAWVSEVTRN